MEWSGDGDNTDYSTSSSPNAGRSAQNQDPDSLSDDDDFSDEFSVIDSDDERRTDVRYSSHPMVQVIAMFSYIYYIHDPFLVEDLMLLILFNM